MKKPSATRGRFHGRGDAPQAQTLQRGIPAHGSQETARRDIDQAADKRRLPVVRAGQRQVAVGQTAPTHEQVLLTIATGSVKPGLLVTSEGTQAEFAADGQMHRTDLVARKYDACKADPEMSCGDARRLEVGAKGVSTAALLQAIEMREGMSTDLLGGVSENSPDQGESIIVWVALFVRADLGKIMIGRDSRVGIIRLARWKGRDHRLFGPDKQEPHRRPGAGDVPLGKEVEQSRYDVANAPDVGTVIRDRALVANAP
ncbi:MAG: hypothetical protein QOE78_3567 [Alphaproteobacteria bacterium]|nr:hypothetical protein [Alphaproteobacteria bacterium]